MSRVKYVRVPDVTGVKTTLKALLIQLEDGRTEWIPFSQISPESEVTTSGDIGELTVAEWIAKDKKLDYNEI